MSYLLDTNVISELSKPSPEPHVLDWCAIAEHRLNAFLSVLTLGEIRKGIEQKRRESPQRADTLEVMLSSLQSDYRDRILPFDQAVADCWGRMLAQDQSHPLDAILAATAQVHGMTLVTRNTRHVATRGVPLVNPFDPQA